MGGRGTEDRIAWDGSFPVPNDSCPLGIPDMPLAWTDSRSWYPGKELNISFAWPRLCECRVSCNHRLLLAGVRPPPYSPKDG